MINFKWPTLHSFNAILLICQLIKRSWNPIPKFLSKSGSWTTNISLHNILLKSRMKYYLFNCLIKFSVQRVHQVSSPPMFEHMVNTKITLIVVVTSNYNFLLIFYDERKLIFAFFLCLGDLYLRKLNHFTNAINATSIINLSKRRNTIDRAINLRYFQPLNLLSGWKLISSRLVWYDDY